MSQLMPPDVTTRQTRPPAEGDDSAKADSVDCFVVGDKTTVDTVMGALVTIHGATKAAAGPDNAAVVVVWRCRGPDGADRSILLHHADDGGSGLPGQKKKTVVLIVYSTLSAELFAVPGILDHIFLRNRFDFVPLTFLLADCTGLNQMPTTGNKVHTMDALRFGFSLCAFKLLKFDNTSALSELFSHICDASAEEPFKFTELAVDTLRDYKPMQQDVPELPIPKVTEISHATPQMAHTITQFNLLHAPHLFHDTVQTMFDTWMETKNWAAIQVIQLVPRYAMEPRCLHASLHDTVPDQLRGFSCPLQLRCFSVKRFPRWTLENPNVLLNMDTQHFNKDIIPHIPDFRNAAALSPGAAQVVVNSFSRNQKLTPTNRRKLVLVGDSGVGKTTLLKCMIQLKKVVTIQKIVPTVGIEMHHNLRFKKGKTGFKWTVWDLGCHTPFHQCYLGSRSIFIVVFDVREAVAIKPPQRPRLYYWLNEIAVAQSRFMRSFEQAQVLLVGTHVEPTLFGDAVQLVNTIYSTEIPVVYIAGIFLLGCKGEAWRYSSTSTNTQAINHPVQEIVDILENQSPYICLSDDGVLKSVPQSWMTVNKELKRKRERTSNGGHPGRGSGDMKWSQFVALANQCGVGRYKFPQQEIEMCANFLYDIGTIIHFRHPFFPFSSNKLAISRMHKMADWVVLDLNWKIAAIPPEQVILPIRALETVSVPVYEGEGSSSAMDDALARFEAIVELDQAPQDERFFSFFSFSVEHSEICIPPLHHFWDRCRGLFGTGCKIQGRKITFPLLPQEVFFKVMTKILNSPDFTPQLVWRDILIVSRPLPPDVGGGDVLFLMSREGNTVSMCLRSDREHSLPSLTYLKDLHNIHAGLWRTILDILEQFTEAMYCQQRASPFPWENKVESSLFCPHCLLDFVVEVGGRLIIDVALKKHQVSAFPRQFINCNQRQFIKAMQKGEQQLPCARGSKVVDLVEIAPDLFLGFTPGVAKNTLTDVETDESAYNTMMKCISDENLMQSIPPHDNVAQVSSVHFQPSPGVVMEPPSVPHPELVLGKSVISLGELVSLLIEKGNNTTTELDRVIPHRLREKILLDVAEGLNHLHSQSPPVVHNGVHPGGILVFSLDESGPCAKISLSKNAKRLFLGTTRGIAGNPDVSFHAPEVLCKTFYNTKADIWSFGTLVWKLHNPLSTLFGHLMNNVLYTETQYTSTMGVYSTVLSPQQIGCGLVNGHIRMESALFHDGGHNRCCSHSPTVITPRWIRQVVSLCCAVDPALRPTMTGILKAWSFFNPGVVVDTL
ncbi:hypothetical protein Pelo_14800 [Pelomyxa schiedti]|nr:hypothetical protein Pelo_14800 [Pelomyxa schiedti]